MNKKSWAENYKQKTGWGWYGSGGDMKSYSLDSGLGLKRRIILELDCDSGQIILETLQKSPNFTP